MKLFGQGATEYLVLLAVVLIVALVSVALLGFFPGMASDAQVAQSQAYWQSAQPISILESAMRLEAPATVRTYMRFRNSGAYPIRITGIIGADGWKSTLFYGSLQGGCGFADTNYNISDYYYLSPGQEEYFGIRSIHGTPCDKRIYLTTSSTSASVIGGASSICQNSATSPGMIDYKSFGFEYIAYIDGQQITKRQIGKDFLVKCGPPT